MTDFQFHSKISTLCSFEFNSNCLNTTEYIYIAKASLKLNYSNFGYVATVHCHAFIIVMHHYSCDIFMTSSCMH